MTFEAPLLLGLLLLPVVALLRSLVRGAPRPALLSTLELLPRAEEVASAAPRRHVPLARLLLALAMVFAVLALARPRLSSVEATNILISKTQPTVTRRSPRSRSI